MEGFQNFNTNFDPNTLANQTSDVIQFLNVVDKSGSVNKFLFTFNTVLTEVFMNEYQTCHRKNDIVVKSIEFNDVVEHKSGFMPVLSLPSNYFEIKNADRTTALYDAVLQGLEHVLQYRNDLEDQGINVRSSIFIATDGCDNASSYDSAKRIRELIENLRKEEKSNFTITVLGVGVRSEFEAACIEMGLNPATCLMTVDALSTNPTPDELEKFRKELRVKMGVVSQSVSSSSNTTTIAF